MATRLKCGFHDLIMYDAFLDAMKCTAKAKCTKRTWKGVLNKACWVEVYGRANTEQFLSKYHKGGE